MDINARAVFVGFLVAFSLEIILAWFLPIPPPLASALTLFILPGAVGGLIAGYMAPGTESGGVHGGLATAVSGLLVLVVVLLFVGLAPTLDALLVGLFIVVAPMIPGVLAGAFGGWASSRRAVRETPATEAR